MFAIIGIAVIFIMVFGGYLLAGGKMGIILHSLPFEMMMIIGAAVGAFLLSNDLSAVKHTAKDVGKVFKGPKWKPGDYRDLLCLLFELIRIARSNPVGRPSVEADSGAKTSASFWAKREVAPRQKARRMFIELSIVRIRTLSSASRP